MTDHDDVDYRFRVIRAAGDTSTEEIRDRLATTITVVVRDHGEFRLQLLALALVELLARLFPRLIIDVDDSAATHNAIAGPRGLSELLSQARERGHPLEPAQSSAVTVLVGASGDAADVVVDASGWQSFVGTRASAFPGGDNMIAIGPLTAAARGAARVFQIVFDGLLDEPAPSEDIYWSALTYARGSAPFDEPGLPLPTTINAVIVGAGSVGGAAVYAFQHTPNISGDLAVVDPQNLEERNYVRAILAAFSAAHAHRAKAQVAQEALATTALDCRPEPTTIAEYVASRPREDVLPLVLSAVDSIESRRSIQDCLPLEVIDAACDHERARVSRHVTGDGPCLYCMYIERVLDGKAIRMRLIATATGFTLDHVSQLLVQNGRVLTAEEVTAIERHRETSPGAYGAYVGRPLDELYRNELLYGETVVGASGDIAVAAPFVTALAGFLLAGEALKAGAADHRPYRLGTGGSLVAIGDGVAVKYEEPLFTPDGALLQAVPRSSSPACLCNSARRRELVRRRYTRTTGS